MPSCKHLSRREVRPLVRPDHQGSSVGPGQPPSYPCRHARCRPPACMRRPHHAGARIALEHDVCRFIGPWPIELREAHRPDPRRRPPDGPARMRIMLQKTLEANLIQRSPRHLGHRRPQMRDRHTPVQFRVFGNSCGLNRSPSDVCQETNAVAESINARMQRVKRMACGFRSRDRFRNAIHFHLGGVQLYPAGGTQTAS